MLRGGKSSSFPHAAALTAGPAGGKMTLTAPNKPPMLRRGGLAAQGFTGPLNTSYFAV